MFKIIFILIFMYVSTNTLAMNPDLKHKDIKFHTKRESYSGGWVEGMVDRVYALSDSDTCLGYVEIPVDTPCTIQKLFVIESARKKGIGKILLEQAIKQAQKSGCLEISGHINCSAKTYFEGLGAKIIRKKNPSLYAKEEYYEYCMAQYKIKKADQK